MQPTTPAANLSGFVQMTTIMALCAKPTHVGSARMLH
jgi:hypothetical protein